MQYWTCPFCHSNLDYGEKCDCQEESGQEKQAGFFAKRMRADSRTGQYTLILDGMEGLNVVDGTG